MISKTLFYGSSVVVPFSNVSHVDMLSGAGDESATLLAVKIHLAQCEIPLVVEEEAKRFIEEWGQFVKERDSEPSLTEVKDGGKYMVTVPTAMNKESSLALKNALTRSFPKSTFLVLASAKPKDVVVGMPDTKAHLCDTCHFDVATCEAVGVQYGDGKGNDNVIACDTFKERQG